jgi:predicted metal-binding membrane protein
MIVAMMAPVLIPAIRHVAARSLPRRRAWSLALLVASYGLVWLTAGLLLTTLIHSAQEWLPDSSPFSLAMVGLATAAVWQLTPIKQRCLNHHMAFPAVPAFGRRSSIGTLRLGATQGLWCLGSCWALMLVPLVPLVSEASHLAAMLGVALWIWAERLERTAAPRWRIRVPMTGLRIVAARLPIQRRAAAAAA